MPETPNEKLIHLLKQVGDMTKSRLAKELETTYLNVHRWVSDPGKLVKNVQMRRDIDSLFKKYIDIRPFVLETVKSIKNPLEILKNNPEIRERFFIKLTYNSNAIEGNRMTERETELIFQDQKISGKISDIMEVVNHRAALICMLDNLKKDFKITEDFILNLHAKVLHGFDSKLPGQYRTGYVNVTNTEVVVPNAQQVPIQMKRLLKSMNDYETDVIGRVALTHHAFEVIHPFFDGNGRVGRLLMISQLLANGLPPAIVRYDDRYNYYWALDQANIKEMQHIIQFVCDCILLGFDLLKQKPA
jgi:Fic family protein